VHRCSVLRMTHASYLLFPAEWESVNNFDLSTISPDKGTRRSVRKMRNGLREAPGAASRLTHQNISFSASCPMRGSPAPVIWPKLLELFVAIPVVADGSLKFTRFKTLKYSARN
jgi:hypothetical protein